MVDYLDRNPDSEPAEHLKDMMSAIIKADKKITAEEGLIISELMVLTEGYLNNGTYADRYHVVIVPQKPGDEIKRQVFSPESVKEYIAGDTAYSACS